MSSTTKNLPRNLYAVLINEQKKIVDPLAEDPGLRDRDVKEFFDSLGLEEGTPSLLEKAIESGNSPLNQKLEKGLNLFLYPLKSYDVWILILKKKEITAQELEEIKKNMLANIQHELLTPLTLVKTSLEASQREDEILDIALEGVLKLERLLTDMLRSGVVTRVEEGEVDMGEVIDVSVEHFRQSAHAKDIHFELEIGDNLPEIKGRQDALVHLMIQLLSNAVKFSYPGGRIEISAHRSRKRRSLDRGEVKVCVRDRGRGIPQGKEGKIFELFFQADSSTTREFEGTGLGLYLAREIVEKQGGKIWAENRENGGASFCFVLPSTKGIEERGI